MSEALRGHLDELKGLNRNRYEYVIARSKASTVAEALRLAGVSQAWYYSFSKDEREMLEELATDLRHARTLKAELILQQAVDEAAQVKVDGLKSRRPEIQQKAASEILDRVQGTAIQRQQHEHSGGVEIVVRYAD